MQILELAQRVQHPVLLIGAFTDERLLKFAEEHPGWVNVDYRGSVPHSDVFDLLSDRDVGLLLLEDIETFRDSTPVKIFDYASMNLLIYWTGAKNCYYKKFFNKNITGEHVGANLSSVKIDYDDYLEIKIDNDLSNYVWEEAAESFYECVDSSISKT